MTAKPKKAGKPEEELKRKSCELEIKKDETKEGKAEKYAKLVASPEFAAYRVIQSADGKTNVHNDIDVPSFVKELRSQSAAANRGDFTHAEAMLMNQATALQTLFTRMVEQANNQSQMPHIEGFMRLALKAQNQCRSTLETLAAIKNPPVIFAKQANINHGNGNQQVNNGTPAANATRTEKTINQQSELLEVNHGSKTMDSGATGETIPTNSAMATVG